MDGDPRPLDTAMTVAEARAAGLTLSRLRSRSWERTAYGVYRRRSESTASDQHLRDSLAILPEGSAFGHLTAAHLYGLWLPSVPSTVPTLVTVSPDADRIVRPGFYVFRSRAGEFTTRSVRDLPVVTPQVCLGQLAEDLSVVDVTIAIDSALHLRLCSVVDIAEAIRSRQRGLPRLRRALELCDGRSESPWESVLRLLHVAAGIDVEPQAQILDERDHVVARADLLIRGTRRLSEYDGAVHRNREQHHADLARDKRLARLGNERFGYVSSEIASRPGRIIRDAEQALGLPSRPDRLAAWLDLSGPSSLTYDGRRRLARRLHRFD